MAEDRPKLLVWGTGLTPQSPSALALAKHFELLFPSDVSGLTPAQEGAAAASYILADGAIGEAIQRAVLEDQAAKVLDSLGEGVCLCDPDGRLIWANRVYKGFPEAARQAAESACAEAARKFASSPREVEGLSHKAEFQMGDGAHYNLLASPVLGKNREGSGSGMTPVVAIMWDDTRNHRMRRRINAIDAAGSELVRIESEAISALNTAQRLELLEDKIIKYTRDLLHFDHFNIYVVDRQTNRLVPVMLVGMPEAVAQIKLFVAPANNGISGYVASTGKSYLCRDTNRDPLYIAGLEHAASSLSVPLRMHDQVIGVFNVESEKPNAFSEEDLQFAEIFGRYVAMALNILDLLLVERFTTRGTVAVNVLAEVSEPLNDITAEAETLRELVLDRPEASRRLERVFSLVDNVRKRVHAVAQGPRSILGFQEAMESSGTDPMFVDRHILVADDEPNIRETVHAVLTKLGARVSVCPDGGRAVELFTSSRPGDFDLILSDISMPDKNGYEVFAAAKHIDPAVPVILMTGFGYDPHHSIVRASQEGLQCVLFKPFQVEQLLEEVRKALRPRTGHA